MCSVLLLLCWKRLYTQIIIYANKNTALYITSIFTVTTIVCVKVKFSRCAP